MLHFGNVNPDGIRSIKGSKLADFDVLKSVNIDKQLLAEKDSWYKIDGTICFLKKREDGRVFGEKISEDIVDSLGIETANYEIVNLNGSQGLLTSNFQDVDKYRYYDLYNLVDLLPFHVRGQMTFKEILEFLSMQNIAGKNELIQELIDRYVLEWVTIQTDGNPHNLMFKYDAENNRLALAPSYDRERCFGITSKESFADTSIWVPAIPYEDQDFKKNPYFFDNELDANIVALYFDYPEETTKALSRIFGIDYEAIFKKYAKSSSQISLPMSTISYLCDIINKKSKEKEKIIAL